MFVGYCNITEQLQLAINYKRHSKIKALEWQITKEMLRHWKGTIMSEPIQRDEKYMAKILGEYDGELPDPITRKEKYLYQMAQHGGV